MLSALELVGTYRGSFGLALDFRRDAQPFPGWDWGEQAVDKLMLGLSAIVEDEPLPEEFDHGVLMSLRGAGRITDRGTNKVVIDCTSGSGSRKAEYRLDTRHAIVARIRKYEQAYAVVEGRLLAADVKEDRLKCRIEPSVGEPVACKFAESLTDQVLRLMRCFVQARGEAAHEPVPGKITLLDIKDLEPVEESAAVGGTKEPVSSFWRSKTFDDLGAEQGVYPVDDLSRISGGWPEGEDIEPFLEVIRRSKAIR